MYPDIEEVRENYGTSSELIGYIGRCSKLGCNKDSGIEASPGAANMVITKHMKGHI